jgi:2-keto-3-deoxy-L-rhamnonate aldolase RhmA
VTFENPVKRRLAAGEATVGIFLSLASPSATELLGHVGFDWLVLETEHGGVGIAETEELLRAAAATGSVALVRVPPRDPVFIQRALDLGAHGLVVPLVESAAEAAAVVQAMRYPPAGTRSFGPLRASRYSLDYDSYLERAGDELLLVLIVETAGAIAELDEIAAVDGVDVLYLGLYDLCLQLGHDPRQMPLPEIDRIVERALEIGRRHGVAVGLGARTPTELVALRERGYRFLGFSTDYFLLLDGARSGLEAWR